MAADNARSVSGQARQPFAELVSQDRVLEFLGHVDRRTSQDVSPPNTSPIFMTLSTMFVFSTTPFYVASCPS